jgi:RNA polymerase sigma-70 factor (ECF subfamily)
LDLLAELFERHHRRLFNFFLRLAPGREAAEDLVQEVFVRMLEYRHTFRNEAEFTPWMFALARNAAVDRYRARPALEVQADPEAPEPAAPSADPIDELEREERTELLQAALRRLPHEKRELLLLARFGEMKYAALAELLGISVGALKLRVHRALRALRHEYQAIAGEARA